MEKGIISVIDELGQIILKHKQEIRFKQHEIDSLRKKIKQIEQYSNFYNDNDPSDSDYRKEIKKA